MLRAHDGAAPRRQLVEHARDRQRAGGIELPGRLVEDEHVRAQGDHARDGHPLLLATRQRKRRPVGQVADAEQGEGGIDARVHLWSRHAQVLEAEGELLAHGQLRCRELIGGRREDDADGARQARPAGLGLRLTIDDQATLDGGPNDARDEPRGDKRQGRLPGRGATGDTEPIAGADDEGEVGEAGLPAAGIADADGVELEPGRLGHRPSPSTTAATTAAAARTIPARSQRSAGGSATLRYDVRSGRVPKPRASRANVRSRTSMSEPKDDRADERHQRSHPREDRARDRQATRLLGLQDGTRSSLHARHHLDDRQDHEGQSMADATGDEGLRGCRRPAS